MQLVMPYLRPMCCSKVHCSDCIQAGVESYKANQFVAKAGLDDASSPQYQTFDSSYASLLSRIVGTSAASIQLKATVVRRLLDLPEGVPSNRPVSRRLTFSSSEGGDALQVRLLTPGTWQSSAGF